MHSITMHYFGYSIVLNECHWLRNENNSPVTAQNFSRKQPFYSWLASDASIVEGVCELIDNHFSQLEDKQKSSVSRAISADFLHNLFDCYIRQQLINAKSTFAYKLLRRPSIKLFGIDYFESLLNVLHPPVREFLFIIRLLFRGVSLNKLLNSSPISTSQLQFIQRILRSHS